MWGITFDSLLALFDAGPIKAFGFADDLALILGGCVPKILVGIIQEAVDMAVGWGLENGLIFGPAKTVMVLFSRGQKVPKTPSLAMSGARIEVSSEVKYLGIILDRKLEYREHIRSKIRKAKGLLMKVKKAVGVLWGPSTRMMRWAYTQMVRPMMSYGAVVWGQHASRFRKDYEIEISCLNPMKKN
jgi:hypothetical protein